MINFIRFVLALSVLMVLSACGGGGGSSSSGNDDDNATGNDNEIGTATLNQNTLVTNTPPQVMTIDGGADAEDGINRIVFAQGASLPTDWEAGKTVLLPASSNLPEGMLLRIESIDTSGSQPIVNYTVPVLEDVLDEAEIEINERLTTDMVQSINVNKRVVQSAELKAVSQLSGTEADSESEYQWFPDTSLAGIDVSGGAGDLVSEITFKFLNGTLLQNADETQFIRVDAAELKIKNPKLDFNYTANIRRQSFLSHLSLDFTQEENFRISASMKKTLGLVAKDSVFACGPKKKIDGGDVSIEIAGAEWPDNDVCLGSVRLLPGMLAVNVGNGSSAKVPIALDIFFVISASLQLEAKATLSYSTEFRRYVGVSVNTARDDVVQSVNVTYDPVTGDEIKPKYDKRLSGELNGSMTMGVGVAPALHILGVYPAVTKGYVATKLEGSLKASIGDDGVDNCYALKAGFVMGYYASFGASAKLNINLPKKWKRKFNYLGTGYSASFGDEIDLVNPLEQDSCLPEGYSVSYDIDTSTQGSVGFSAVRVSNDGVTITPSQIVWRVYDASGNLVKEITAASVAAQDLLLAAGDYTVVMVATLNDGQTLRKIMNFSVQGSTVDAPQNFRATPGDQQITFTWDTVANADKYTLYIAEQSGLTPDNYSAYQGGRMVDNVTSPYTLAGLTNDKTYYAIITATNNNTESPASTQLSTTPKGEVVVYRPLNDTGRTTCYGTKYGFYSWEHQTNSAQPCDATYEDDGISVSQYQDGHHGRDVTHNDDSDGHAGFSFTKIGANGEDLPFSSIEWHCLRDNVTGLIWEVKQGLPDDTVGNNGLHDPDDRYTWYQPDNAINGGHPGYEYADESSCYGYVEGSSDTYCNTYKYVERINTNQLCGMRNWRVPSRAELLSITNFHVDRDTSSSDMKELFRLPLDGSVWSDLSESYLSSSGIVSYDAAYVFQIDYFGMRHSTTSNKSIPQSTLLVCCDK